MTLSGNLSHLQVDRACLNEQVSYVDGRIEELAHELESREGSISIQPVHVATQVPVFLRAWALLCMALHSWMLCCSSKPGATASPEREPIKCKHMRMASTLCMICMRSGGGDVCRQGVWRRGGQL